MLVTLDSNDEFRDINFMVTFYHSPAGWDNEKKIAILNENLHGVKPDQYYTDVIARPIVRAARSTNRELEVAAIV